MADSLDSRVASEAEINGALISAVQLGGPIALNLPPEDPNHSDARLVDLHRQWMAAEAQLNARGELTDEEIDAILDRQGEVEALICSTPAATLAGLVVKLSLAADNVSGSSEDFAPERALKAALQDAIRMAAA